MKSIIYICPTAKNKPTGGIKIIYRHVEILSKLLPKSVESKIFHFEDIIHAHRKIEKRDNIGKVIIDFS